MVGKKTWKDKEYNHFFIITWPYVPSLEYSFVKVDYFLKYHKNLNDNT